MEQQTSNTMAENQKILWDNESVMKLKKYYAKHIPASDIATILGRSSQSIYQKIKCLKKNNQL